MVLVMTSYRDDSTWEICARVKHLGYAASQRIRIYGEEFDVVSDPFPEANGIAIRVKRRGESRIRILQLPATLLYRGRKLELAKAA
jgi:hypothetical protein